MSNENKREKSNSRGGEQGNRRNHNDAHEGRFGQRAFRSRGAKRLPTDFESESERRSTEPTELSEPRPRDASGRHQEYSRRPERRFEGRTFNTERRSVSGVDHSASSGRQSDSPRSNGLRSGGGRPTNEFNSPRGYLTPHQERERRRRERMLAGEDPDELDDEDEFNRIKGARQAIRRKKRRKVRVFFHRRLTRINLVKLLTKARYLSPFLATQFVESGRVKVNARVVSSALYEINLRKERVTIDDVPAEWPRRYWYMVYHKPRNVVCERGDPQFDELFEPNSTWHFPFGRLGRARSGLIVVSNDPRMRRNQHFTDRELQKEYRIRINRRLTDNELTELRNGVCVGDDYLVPIRVVVTSTSRNTMTVDITLLDDAFSSIFGALKALNVEPLSMRRTRIGFLNEAMIPHGEWRELTGYEIQGLQLARFTPGELPPEPEPEPRVRFQRFTAKSRTGADRTRLREGGDRHRRDNTRTSRVGSRGFDGRGERVGSDRSERSNSSVRDDARSNSTGARADPSKSRDMGSQKEYRKRLDDTRRDGMRAQSGEASKSQGSARRTHTDNRRSHETGQTGRSRSHDRSRSHRANEGGKRGHGRRD